MLNTQRTYLQDQSVTRSSDNKKIYDGMYISKYYTVCYYHFTCKFQSEATLYSLPECQGTPCSKQALCLKFK